MVIVVRHSVLCLMIMMSVGTVLIFLRSEMIRRWINHWSLWCMAMRRQTYGYLPSPEAFTFPWPLPNYIVWCKGVWWWCVFVSFSRESCATLRWRTGQMFVSWIIMLLIPGQRSPGFGSCLLIPLDAELSTLMTRLTPSFTVLYVA